MIVILVIALVIFVVADIRAATNRAIRELPIDIQPAASKPCAICGARPFLDECDAGLHS